MRLPGGRGIFDHLSDSDCNEDLSSVKLEKRKKYDVVPHGRKPFRMTPHINFTLVYTNFQICSEHSARSPHISS